MAARPLLLRTYGVLAVAGAVLPYTILIPWVQAHGFDPLPFFLMTFANGPAAIFSADVLFSSVVFLIFMVAEGRRAGVPHLWAPPVALCVFGLCCAFPLFLWLRERRLGREPRG